MPTAASRWPALDRPALGLVMQLAALFALRSQLSLAVTMLSARVCVRAVLRNDAGASARAMIAMTIAIALFITMLVWLYLLLDTGASIGFRFSVDQLVWPLAVLIATLGTLGWSERRPVSRPSDDGAFTDPR